MVRTVPDRCPSRHLGFTGIGRVTSVMSRKDQRGLVETAACAWRVGVPPDPVGVGVLRMAAWQAGYAGPEGRLLHPLTMRPEPAADVVVPCSRTHATPWRTARRSCADSGVVLPRGLVRAMAVRRMPWSLRDGGTGSRLLTGGLGGGRRALRRSRCGHVEQEQSIVVGASGFGGVDADALAGVPSTCSDCEVRVTGPTWGCWKVFSAGLRPVTS